MHNMRLFSTVMVLLVIQPSLRAAEPAERGQVSLAVAAERDQPAGWPVVVEVTMTNTGTEPIRWWCAGPGRFPGAEHFKIRVRIGAEQEWRDATATNGQYVQGSGIDEALKPGESIVVPLAVPIDQPGGLHIIIEPRDWDAEPVQASVTRRDDRDQLDERRARAITAVLTRSEPFWRHLAEQYADDVVIDAMVKMATVDNARLALGAARVLRHQPTLPATFGDTLAPMPARWLNRQVRPRWGGLQEDILHATLKTQSESARQAVLDLLQQPLDTQVRGLVIHALAQSPGDAEWFGRAQTAIRNLMEQSQDDPELQKRTEWGIGWLESRLTHPQ